VIADSSVISLHSERIARPDGRPFDVLELARQRVQCIVGLYPSEELAPQPLDVSLALHLDTSPAADDTGLRHSIDYARLEGEVRFLLESCRFRTIEAAAHALARYALAPATPDLPHARVEAVDVTLTKPHALRGEGAGVPSLRLRRFAADQKWVTEEKPWGLVDVVFEHSGCGIYRLRLAAGGTIPTHVHRRMEEAELALGSGLTLQGRSIRAGTAFRWPHGLAHRWHNPTASERTILCVDRPRFMPDDEVEVGVALADLPEVRGRSYYPLEGSADPLAPESE